MKAQDIVAGDTLIEYVSGSWTVSSARIVLDVVTLKIWRNRIGKDGRYCGEETLRLWYPYDEEVPEARATVRGSFRQCTVCSVSFFSLTSSRCSYHSSQY